MCMSSLARLRSGSRGLTLGAVAVAVALVDGGMTIRAVVAVVAALALAAAVAVVVVVVVAAASREHG